MPDRTSGTTRTQEIIELRKMARRQLYKAKTQPERAAIIRD